MKTQWSMSKVERLFYFSELSTGHIFWVAVFGGAAFLLSTVLIGVLEHRNGKGTFSFLVIPLTLISVAIGAIGGILSYLSVF